jgi:uncharacterized protein with von Willebrand factor type A (vWA) domain
VGLALADTARRQRRAFAGCWFNGAVQAAYRWPRGQAPPDELLAFATVGASGGTSYDAALGWGLTVLDERPFQQADLVLVTDGECDLDPAIRTRLDALRVFRQALLALAQVW